MNKGGTQDVGMVNVRWEYVGGGWREFIVVLVLAEVLDRRRGQRFASGLGVHGGGGCSRRGIGKPERFEC